MACIGELEGAKGPRATQYGLYTDSNMVAEPVGSAASVLERIQAIKEKVMLMARL